MPYGNKTYTWAGKFLTEVADADGSKTQFEYDANGFRTQKRQYGADGRLEYYVEYLWLDGKLTQQALTLMAYRSDGTSYGIGPISAKFVYEENSQQPQSCLIGDTVLLFVRNLQGDVVAVVNGDGSIWAEFTYDAWGNVEVTSPLEDESIREAALKMLPLLCPLTYRGYNYDFTTGLYYLQSRYYNPEWGRFLNCDDTSILLSTQGTTHGANLFAYCENNPVNSVDYTGYWKADTHEEMTRSIGRHFFTEYVAQVLAEADAATDSLFPPFPPLNHPLVGSWHWIQNQGIHFNRNPPELADSRLVFALIMLVAAAQNWANAEYNFAISIQASYERWLLAYRCNESIKYLGYGLHAYQDFEAHGNIGVNNYIAQHIVSSNGRYIHKADDIYYSWTNDSRTALTYDPNQTRYYRSRAMTRIYLETFRDLVYMYRNDYNICITGSPLL